MIMKGYIVIPARYGSTRLPGKLLLSLGNKPLIRWTVENALMVKDFQVILATDDERIARSVEDLPIKIIFTPSNLPSGSDRVAEALKTLFPLPLVVNLQGDEPFMDAKIIEKLANAHQKSKCEIFTLAREIKSDEDPDNPNIVKVALGINSNAVYFSRSPIPFYREDKPKYLIHLGIYSYRWESLFRFVSFPPGRLEQIEKLEQLRALENGLCIGVKVVEYEGVGIDTEEDLVKAEELLQMKSKSNTI